MGIWRLWRTLAIISVLLQSFSTKQESSQTIKGLRNSSKVNLEDSKMQEDEYKNLYQYKDSNFEEPHSRKKRLIWVTDDGRLALPPGTTLSITPTIALPLVRHPPEGFLSNITISLPLSIDFDKLGLTDNQNPLGELPPVFARSFGRAAGDMLGTYISRYLKYRSRRDLQKFKKPKSMNRDFKINFAPHNKETVPELPEQYKTILHGGERALLYGTVEDILSTFGMDGRACLLRAICEVHSRSLEYLGVFGEIFKLFLTATKSPFSEHIPDYVKAQKIGQGIIGPGECFPYYKNCSKSLFKSSEKYDNRKEKFSENVIDNEINSEFVDTGDNISGRMLSM